MLLDPQRILPEHLRRERLVHIGMDRLRTEEGLAQADLPGVGVDLDPDDVGELGQASFSILVIFIAASAAFAATACARESAGPETAAGIRCS